MITNVAEIVFKKEEVKGYHALQRSSRLRTAEGLQGWQLCGEFGKGSFYGAMGGQKPDYCGVRSKRGLRNQPSSLHCLLEEQRSPS